MAPPRTALALLCLALALSFAAAQSACKNADGGRGAAAAGIDLPCWSCMRQAQRRAAPLAAGIGVRPAEPLARPRSAGHRCSISCSRWPCATPRDAPGVTRADAIERCGSCRHGRGPPGRALLPFQVLLPRGFAGASRRARSTLIPPQLPIDAAAEVAALLELKAMPGNDAQPELSNWVGCPCNASAPSRWAGVKCSNGRVVEM